MSDYRIEKRRCPARLTLANGHCLSGDLFVQRFARFRNAPEEPLDLLNDDDPFLPLATDADDLCLVQMAIFAMVGVPLPSGDDSVDASIVGMHVEFTLVDGSAHVGTLFPELRAGRPRLIDFLNDTSLRFLALFTTEQLRLVNRAHIAYVRQVS